MDTLHIDIETYSPEPLADTGLYRYAEHPDFRILLFAYAFDDEPITCIDLESGEALPDRVRQALTDPGTIKTAHNAVFERICIGRHFRLSLDPVQWRCTMVQCARCGLPMSLYDAGKVLGFEEQKMTEGKQLIKLFSVPNKKTGRRTLPADDPESWETFKRYVIRDVEVERNIDRELDWNPESEEERRLYAIDQDINDRGVCLDLQLVRNAAKMDAVYKAQLNVQAQKLTGLDNPNSVAQLKKWIEELTGEPCASLSKTTLPELAERSGDPRIGQLIRLRTEMAKTSNAKYTTMLDMVCRDGRIRGLLQFHGARTGRWAGRGVQIHNLPQNHLDGLDFAREAVRSGDQMLVELCYGNVSNTLSQLIRTAFVAPEGMLLSVNDFSAIEARVVTWLAGEDWVLDVFRGHGKIYEATAAQMYHCDISEIGKTDPRRQKGKIAVLALGYGGGVSALEAMGGKRMGLTQDEMEDTVRSWRKANPNIVVLWKDIENAAKKATTGVKATTHGLAFGRIGTTVTVTLPSGRMLCYPEMQLTTNRFGSISLKYKGLDQTTQQWKWIETYGGKMTENIVQAIARDCLAHTMTLMADRGYRIDFHVHDEIIAEVENQDQHEEIAKLFSISPDWAEGLPLKGAGFTTRYYLKD